MNVVGYSAHLQEDAFFTTNDPANIAIQRILQRVLDQWLALFRAVDHMKERRFVYVPDMLEILLSPLRGFRVLGRFESTG